MDTRRGLEVGDVGVESAGGQSPLMGYTGPADLLLIHSQHGPWGLHKSINQGPNINGPPPMLLQVDVGFATQSNSPSPDQPIRSPDPRVASGPGPSKSFSKRPINSSSATSNPPCQTQHPVSEPPHSSPQPLILSPQPAIVVSSPNRDPHYIQSNRNDSPIRSLHSSSAQSHKIFQIPNNPPSPSPAFQRISSPRPKRVGGQLLVNSVSSVSSPTEESGKEEDVLVDNLVSVPISFSEGVSVGRGGVDKKEFEWFSDLMLGFGNSWNKWVIEGMASPPNRVVQEAFQLLSQYREVRARMKVV
ncbi:hypothetical protein Salat_0861200 [Sesamum alatum]|uniref:Uncharacterized protein n=1 Tax=Sesamum alatum TaxID=300844 RepID=A0AAE1YJ12_9LAMI|nr:hypothetical protein Salat_0861200 [Sesamum alatum]